MKNKYFRILLLISIISTISIDVYSQVNVVESNSTKVNNHTYRILNLPNLPDLSSYDNAMEEANFDSYRYINARRKLTFDSGIVIELLSIYELQKLNISVDESKAKIYNSEQETNPIYSLSSNGHILARYKSENQK